MVPGSTLRYGSSFWRETVRWRAFRMFPIDAAVMPFPNEETTPPVTKTYFDIETSRAVLRSLPGGGRRLNLWLDFRLQDDDFGVVLARGGLQGELRLRLGGGHGHLLEEAIQGVELQLQARDRVVHGHDVAWLELPDDLRRLRGVDHGAPADRHQKDVGRRDRLRLGVFERAAEVAQVADAHVVDLDQVDRVAPVPGALLRVVE